MSEVVKIVPPPPTKAAKATKRAKRLNLELRASLRKNKFDPVTQLVNAFPHLEPAEQVKACLELISFLAPKLKPIEPDPKPGSKTPSTNIQINVPASGSTPSTALPPSGETASGSPPTFSIDQIYAIARSGTKSDASE